MEGVVRLRRRGPLAGVRAPVIPLPELTAAQTAALAADMQTGPYLMRPSVQMLDLDHRVLGDLSDRVMDGQVDVRLNGKVSQRSASVTFADPRREVAIDSADPARGALFYDNMLQIGIAFKGPRLGRWVTIPIFCGPITDAVRSGNVARATCQDKSRLATGMAWSPKSYPKGAGRAATITSLLVGAGEHPARVKLPSGGGRLPGDLVVGRTDRAWQPVLSIAEAWNRQGMYDGRGDFRVRSWPTDPKVVFRDGPNGTILTAPEVTYSSYEGFNGVWVRGKAKPNGKRPEATVWLPAAHPLSPTARARRGVPFRVAFVVESNKVRTDAEARALADLHLRRLVREVVNVTVDVMPNWLLEPGDVIAIQTRAIGHVEQLLTEYSLPLMPGAVMSVGAVKQVPRPMPARPKKK